ncbi:MAG: ABC transporter permease [Chloroflexi bacterium]|nr:ABC transporter permease [Chloroflexota bacterium]
MNGQRLLAVIRKELIQIRRDRTTLALVIGIPVAELLMFGYALNTVTDHLPLVVYDQSRSAASRDFATAFQNTGYFDLAGAVNSAPEAQRAIDAGRAKAALIIPPSFGDDVLSGSAASAQLLIDGSDPNVAQTALFTGGLVAGVKSNSAADAVLSRLGRMPNTMSIDLRPVVLYNPRMLSVDFMVPALIGLIVQLQGVLLTAFAVVRERERGTLEQLVVSPVKPLELLLGKLLPNVVLATFSIALALLIARLLFGVESAGSVPLLFVLTMPFLFSAVGIGLMISVAARNQAQALQLTMFTFLPSVLLSGFVFAREGMPGVFQAVSLAIPMTYYLQILRGVILKGVGWSVLWPQFAALSTFALAVLGLAVARFRKTME